MNDQSFINTVSNIITEGSSNAVGLVPFSGQRWGNFNLIMKQLQLKDPDPTYHWIASSTLRQHRKIVGKHFLSLLLGGATLDFFL